jgi:hypothetical protein
MDADKNITASFFHDPKYENLIKNGDFSAGQNDWNPQVISPAMATLSFNGGIFKAAIETISEQAWHINILQPGILLDAYKSYTLTFDAKAETSKVILVKAQFDHSPWTSSLEEKVAITNNMQTYSVSWFQEKPADSYKVGFFFGTDTTDVWIDNVKLIKVITSVENKEEINPPQEMLLMQNYPNPFNPETTIPYQLSEASTVRLEIINFLGQRVATLVNEQQSAGMYHVKWHGITDDGKKATTGIYIYRLVTNESTQIKKFILAK